VGEAAWLAEQRARWTCACGTKLSWYIRECPKCGRDLTGPW
jgi:ribosomal protein S27AE